jgi:hypothetical protein
VLGSANFPDFAALNPGYGAADFPGKTAFDAPERRIARGHARR